MEMFEDNLVQQAKIFNTAQIDYSNELKNLLKEIYQNYQLMIKDKIQIHKTENKIRDILVDDYLSKNINDYTFEKEKDNNLGRVDIFIQESISNEEAEFIIECKLLNNKNINGKDGLNGKYITNGIQRFLTEHYYLKNNFNTNIMIGFIIEKIDISSNIEAINRLSNKIFKNIVEIIQPIKLEDKYIYKSSYQTGKPQKDFELYHLMMDFSYNPQSYK